MPEGVEHKTERGALLAALEHGMIKPGMWEVEGYLVQRHPMRGFRNKWLITKFNYHQITGSFTEALQVIASRV